MERAQSNIKQDFRRIDKNTVEYRGQRFKLNRSTRNGHQGQSLSTKRRRLQLLEIEK
jgi:hypothetical protein